MPSDFDNIGVDTMNLAGGTMLDGELERGIPISGTESSIASSSRLPRGHFDSATLALVRSVNTNVTSINPFPPAPFTIQELKAARNEIERLISEQKVLREAFNQSGLASRAVEESILKVAQRLRNIKSDLQLCIHRFEVLGKTTSSDISEGHSIAPFKRFHQDVVWKIDWERKELKRLCNVVESGDASLDNDMMKARDVIRGRLIAAYEVSKIPDARTTGQERGSLIVKNVSYMDDREDELDQSYSNVSTKKGTGGMKVAKPRGCPSKPPKLATASKEGSTPAYRTPKQKGNLKCGRCRREGPPERHDLKSSGTYHTICRACRERVRTLNEEADSKKL